MITLSSAAADLELTLKTGMVVHAPYSISKAALNMVNTKYAAEYGDQGFIFLSLSPGVVATAETMRELLSLVLDDKHEAVS